MSHDLLLSACDYVNIFTHFTFLTLHTESADLRDAGRDVLYATVGEISLLQPIILSFSHLTFISMF